MDYIDKHSKAIDDYVSGKLGKTERQNFQVYLKESPDIKEEAEFRRLVSEGIKEIEDNKIRELVFSTERKMNNQHKLKNGIIYFLSIAASASIFLIAYFMFFESHEKGRYVSENFTPPENFFLPQLRNGLNNEPAYEAMCHYDNKQFMLAATQLNELHKKQPSNLDYKFYAAAGYLEIGHEKKALELLNNYLEFEKTIYYYHVIWYLALIQLDIGDFPEAVLLLEKLCNSSNQYSAKAEQLLSQL